MTLVIAKVTTISKGCFAPKNTIKSDLVKPSPKSYSKSVPHKFPTEKSSQQISFTHINQFAQTDFDCMELSENTQEAYIEAARGSLPELTLASQTNVYVAMHGHC